MSNPRRENKLVRFARLDGADKWLLMRAVAWLGVARLRLAFTSFQQLSERLSNDARILVWIRTLNSCGA